RSASLLTEVSQITVYLDNHPVGTVRLDGDPTDAWWKTLRFRVGAGAFHMLEFRAYHRTHLPCEPAEMPGMWSRILADSFLRLRSHLVPPALSLSQWPYPFRDDRDPDPRHVVIALPEVPNAIEMKAAGYVASWLGHKAPWRPLD